MFLRTAFDLSLSYLDLKILSEKLRVESAGLRLAFTGIDYIRVQRNFPLELPAGTVHTAALLWGVGGWMGGGGVDGGGVPGWMGGGVPMLHVDFKKWQCPPV